MLTLLVDYTLAFIYYCEVGLMHLLVSTVEIQQHIKIWAIHFLQNFSLAVTELNYMGMCNGLFWLDLYSGFDILYFWNSSLLCSCTVYFLPNYIKNKV